MIGSGGVFVSSTSAAGKHGSEAQTVSVLRNMKAYRAGDSSTEGEAGMSTPICVTPADHNQRPPVVVLTVFLNRR